MYKVIFGSNFLRQYTYSCEQECIPVGCIQMHSSRMHTGRSLTVCRSLLPGGGYARGGGGVCLGGEVCSRGGCLVWGGAWSGGGVGIPACTPPCEQNDKRV